MADRSVSVLLKANVTGFIAGIEQAQLKTRDFAKDAEQSATKHSESWDKVGKGMMLTGGAIAVGVGLAVKTFADFDQSMSRAQAGTMATGSSLAALRTAAIDAGAATQFSATEAADAITAMGKAGVSTKDILGGGLTGALSLAAAGELDVATASEIAATAMNQFGLQGKDIPHIADLLAAGAGKAMGSVQDLAGALKFVGPVAKGLGISIEQTTGTLAMFAQQGILGEQAGTSMRGMLLSLTSPSKIAKGAMDDLGISVYDGAGKFVGLDGVAGQLHDKLGPLSEATRNQALGQIFGNEQVTAARVLYEGGAGAVQEWTAKVNDAGFAAKQAAMLTDNLKGDVERLGGSLSSVLIQSGSGANGMLRTMTQNLQGVVDLYGSAPVPIQQGATALGAVTAAALLAGGGMITMLPKIAATKAALADMGRTGELVSKAISSLGKFAGPVGAALAVGALAFGYYAKQAQESKARVDELSASLDQQTGALTANTAATVSKKLSDDGSIDSARKMGIAAGDLTNAYLGQPDAINRVVAAANAYAIAGGDAGDSMTNEMAAAEKLTNGLSVGNAEMDRAKAAVKALSAEQAAAIDPTTGLTGAQKASADALKASKEPTQAQAASEKDLAAAADAAKKAHDALTASVTGFGSAMLAARGDERGYEAAIDAATKSVKENGRTLDIGTEKGRNNQSALDAIATSALKMAESTLTAAEANGTLGNANKTVTGDVDKARTAFINAAVSMGMNKTEAASLATQAGLTAGRVGEITDKLIALGGQKPNPTVNANTNPAQVKVDAIQAKIDAIRQGKVPGLTANSAAGQAVIDAYQREIDRLHGKSVEITYYFTRTGSLPTGNGSVIPGFHAAGGYVTGPGSGTSDSIPANLSNGEFVIRAASVKKVGLPALHQINSYAGGGPVTPTPSYVAAPQYSSPTNGATSADIRALGVKIAEISDRQTRTAQTMQRQMA